MNQSIIEAIENREILEFYYDGELRVVEPHCYGETTAGNEGLRAYQVDGYSSSGRMGWKLYNLSNARNIQSTEENFNVRHDYKKGDSGMSSIYAEI
ncbi:hypothetical protein ACW6QP_05300 [Salegentibacter sp. HM20]